MEDATLGSRRAREHRLIARHRKEGRVPGVFSTADTGDTAPRPGSSASRESFAVTFISCWARKRNIAVITVY